LSTSMRKPKHALNHARVVSVEKLNERKPVYNLTIEDSHNYFANGILVHNCDETRYWAMRVFYGIAKVGPKPAGF